MIVYKTKPKQNQIKYMYKYKWILNWGTVPFFIFQ